MAALEDRKKKKHSTYSWLVYSPKCFPICSSKKSSSSPSSSSSESKNLHNIVLTNSKTNKRKPGGWKSMPFILGNESFERLGSYGMLVNMMVYLVREFGMEQSDAANVIYIWSGVSNFAPLLGAFISDAYVGRFWTISFASFASLIGMMILTLIAWIPHLHPPPCNNNPPDHDHHCKGPTPSQLGILIMALGFLSIGTGGVRPCSLPFGVDQFDSTSQGGRKSINSFFNWYYTTFTVVLIIALTLVVYIQDSVSWVLGFGLLTIFMVCSIVVFLCGTKIYVYVKPEGSVFSGIAQPFVAAYKKRRLRLPAVAGETDGVFYDPPGEGTVVKKLPLTNQFKFLNKAAMIMDGEINTYGSQSNPWRLSSIQQVEEVKCLIRVLPIWASGIICYTTMVQQGTFTVSQALKMGRQLGPKFQIPPGSLNVISMLTIGLWVPLYDRAIVPGLRKLTKLEGGISLLQRVGLGLVFSILSMVVAGFIERMRRASALSGVAAPLSVMWLAPQLVLMGFAEAFNIIGQVEFYYKEFPDNLSSVANAFYYCNTAVASYFSSLLVTTVHGVTGKNGRPDWLTKDINAGRVDYYYFLIAGLGVLNFIYFVFCAWGYRYKSDTHVMEEKNEIVGEINGIRD